MLTVSKPQLKGERLSISPHERLIFPSKAGDGRSFWISLPDPIPSSSITPVMGTRFIMPLVCELI